MRLKLLLPTLLAATGAWAQLTLNVTSIPFNTPPNATLYAAGTFNTWNPGDPNSTLTKLNNGVYTITINPTPGQVKFKFTRGSWATVEGNAGGGYLPDRIINYTGQPTSVDLTILSWEDLGAGTNEPNVQILDNDFYIPQLDRTRRIWVYLPPDYAAATTKHYPVLYMHDGQNLFDPATAFLGQEWQVDESLTELFNLNDYGCIVVGIDNGGAYRLDEYSPWVNTTYGGGQGDLYVDFIAETLKPHIDSTFRTLPGRISTGIMGSSMGGLISMYGLIERQDVFSKAGVFSPAFWFGGDNSVNHVLNTGKQADARVYFLAGGEEPASVEQNMADVADAMLEAGFSTNEIYWSVPADGEHSEWFWRREFPAAYIWLFEDALSAANEPGGQAISDLEVFPNPAATWVRVADLEPSRNYSYQILGADGRRWRNSTLQGGEPVWTGDLPPGFYILQVRVGTEAWRSARVVKY